jgi:hypothetical protein
MHWLAQVPLAVQLVPPLSVHAVPAAAKLVPHVLLVHVSSTQAVVCAGQSLGPLHATQLPLPSQTVPP